MINQEPLGISSNTNDIQKTGFEGAAEKPLFKASYSLIRSWGSLLLMSPALLFFMIVPYAFKENYLPTSGNLSSFIAFYVFSLASLSLLYRILDALFFEQICFYSDRITKSWYFINYVRTIYYSEAKVYSPRRLINYSSTPYSIRQTNQFGKTLHLKQPISFWPFFVETATVRKIEAILDYLVEYNESDCAVIKKTFISAEELNSALTCIRKEEPIFQSPFSN